MEMPCAVRTPATRLDEGSLQPTLGHSGQHFRFATPYSTWSRSNQTSQGSSRKAESGGACCDWFAKFGLVDEINKVGSGRQ